MTEISGNADDERKTKIIIIITRLDQSNVLDWKVSSFLYKTQFILKHIMLKRDADHQSDFAKADLSSIQQ